MDYFIHKPEGVFPVAVVPGMPISCELYERLKARGGVVVPGHYFFPGLDEPWQHRYECIRMSYARTTRWRRASASSPRKCAPLTEGKVRGKRFCKRRAYFICHEFHEFYEMKS